MAGATLSVAGDGGVGGGSGGGGLRRVASCSGSGLAFATDCADRLVSGASLTTSTLPVAEQLAPASSEKASQSLLLSPHTGERNRQHNWLC